MELEEALKLIAEHNETISNLNKEIESLKENEASYKKQSELDRVEIDKLKSANIDSLTKLATYSLPSDYGVEKVEPKTSLSDIIEDII